LGSSAAASGVAAGAGIGLPTAQPFALPALNAGAAAAAPTDGRIPASPGSPDFAPQLAAHVTTFVRDGVQHARLELNPAEMGPVTVQIQLDGANAQVHMAAENAQTRQALEQAMPALAGSLREAGLTLSGGGVSDQPRQPADPSRQNTPGGSNARGDAAAGATETAAAAGRRDDTQTLRRRGVVDLVA
jgi:flagellar hook-length control protein FliK